MSSINVKARPKADSWLNKVHVLPDIRSSEELSLFHGEIISEIKIVEMVFRKHRQKLVLLSKTIEDIL